MDPREDIIEYGLELLDELARAETAVQMLMYFDLLDGLRAVLLDGSEDEIWAYWASRPSRDVSVLEYVDISDLNI